MVAFCFTFFICVSAVFKFLQIIFKQFLLIVTGRFIVSMISFILSSFDILPSLSKFINFYRDTSRIAFARSGDQISRFLILLSDASASRVPVVMRLSISSMCGISFMVSVLFLIPSLILSVCVISLWRFTNAWRYCLYRVTRLMSFAYNCLLEASMVSWNLFWRKEMRSTSMKEPRWSDGDT